MADDDASRETTLDHIAITGRVYASKSLCRAIKSAQWKLNIIYNAMMDSRRDFAVCVEHSLAWSNAKAAGKALPEAPPQNDGHRGIGDRSIPKTISRLVNDNPALGGLPLTAYLNSADEADRARRKHVQTLVERVPGAPGSRLRMRSMRQAATIKTQNFRLYERRGPDWTPSCWPQHRSDSPKATRGRTKIKLAIQGLPRFNANLSRPIPMDADVKQVVLTMEPNRGAVRISLICTVPTRNQDELAHDRAWATHAILREMPNGLTAQDALAWARDRGIRIRGDDLGIGAPSADDEGFAEARVAPKAAEVRKIADLQRRLSHKDEMALAALPPDQQAQVRAGKAKPPKRSKAAQRIRAQIARAGRTMRNRSRTAGYARARQMVVGVDIIATDPPEMAGKLIRKGGPAERRSKAEAPNVAARGPSDWMMSPAQKRAMRRNMAATGGALRIRRTSLTARQAGVLHVMPGNAGTSSECPRCGVPKENALNARRLDCACGCKLPRDQASAQITAARALYALKVSSDPDGHRAWREADEAATRLKSSIRKAAMADGRRRNRGRSGPPSGEQTLGHKHRREITVASGSGISN